MNQEATADMVWVECWSNAAIGGDSQNRASCRLVTDRARCYTPPQLHPTARGFEQKKPDCHLTNLTSQQTVSSRAGLRYSETETAHDQGGSRKVESQAQRPEIACSAEVPSIEAAPSPRYQHLGGNTEPGIVYKRVLVDRHGNSRIRLEGVVGDAYSLRRREKR